MWVVANADHGIPALIDVSASFGVNATGYEPETALQVDEAGSWQVGQLLRPRGRKLYPSAYLAVAGELEITSWFTAEALIDTGEIRQGSTLEPALEGVTFNSRSAADEARANVFIRELELALRLGAMRAAVGRKRSAVGGGLVYDDYGNGAFLEVNARRLGLGSWRAAASGVVVGDTIEGWADPSPLLAASATYELSLFESVEVFGAVFFDRGNALADLLASAVTERLILDIEGELAEQDALSRLFGGSPASIGTLGYAGLAATWLPLRGLIAEGNAALSVGHLSVDTNPNNPDSPKIAFDLLGYAADLRLRYGISDSWELEATGFLLSGDSAPRNGERYDAFIGVAPYWVWTGLFFSGGLNQAFYAGRATAAGVNGHGVGGGGPAVSYGGRWGYVQLGAWWLQAFEPPPAAPFGGSGRHYGVEADLRGVWRLTSFVSLNAEMDLLQPGSYFPEREFAYRLLGWLNVAVGN